MIGGEKNNPEGMEGDLVAKKTKIKQIEQNDPCPCGSGKKYQDCCLSKEKDKAKDEDKAKDKGKAKKARANSKKPAEKENVHNQLANEKSFPGFKDDDYRGYPHHDAQEVVYDG